MRIVCTTDYRLSPADLEGIRRLRRNLHECQFAVLTDRVAVMLLTEETDAGQLLEMAREQIGEALGRMPDFIRCGTMDGCALTYLPNGQICVLGGEDEPEDSSLMTYLYLRSMGLSACERMPVMAIVTGEDTQEIEIDPSQTDPAAPARDYLAELADE